MPRSSSPQPERGSAAEPIPLFDRARPSLRPDLRPQEQRAQGRSRLAAGHRRRRRAAALTGASTLLSIASRSGPHLSA